MAEFFLQTTASGKIPTENMTLDGVLDSIQGEGLAWLDILKPNKKVRKFLLETMDFAELAVEDVFGPADTTAQKFNNH